MWKIWNLTNKEPPPPPPPPPKKKFPLLPKIINGGIAGIVGVTTVFPLDLVKTRLQNQPKVGPHGEKMYKNMLDCFKKTYQSEGYFGMYRGSGVNILLITPEKAIKLTANDYFRHQFTTKDGKLPYYSQMAAGGLAGTFQIVVTTPMELLKIQMQDAGRIESAARESGHTVERSSALTLAIKMVRENGIFGLYKGLGATFFRDVSFSILYFPLFAIVNDKGPRKENNPNEAVFWWSFLSGLGSGAFCAWIVTPLDVFKTRLQAAHGENEPRYDGYFDVIRKTLRNEGISAFFKGGLCRIIVIAPLFGIAQMVYYLGVGEKLLGYFK